MDITGNSLKFKLIFEYLPDITRSVGGSVGFTVGAFIVFVSKSKGLEMIRGPLSKHCMILVAAVLAEGSITFDIISAIQPNIPVGKLEYILSGKFIQSYE